MRNLESPHKQQRSLMTDESIGYKNKITVND